VSDDHNPLDDLSERWIGGRLGQPAWDNTDYTRDYQWLGQPRETRPRMIPNTYVYISGPMTAKDGYSIERNVAEGVDLFLDLLRRGIPAHCPHLTGLSASCWIGGIDHATWLELDKIILDRCTHVLMMPRWETSTGARIEREYAQSRGVPVYYSLPELLRGLGIATVETD
jgi:hypothetical protein